MLTSLEITSSTVRSVSMTNVVRLTGSCDGDAVLLEVDQIGGACHTGDHSCFDADLLLEPPTA